MKPIDLITAKRLIDYSGGDDSLQGLAELQIRGAVALQNRIADPKIGLGYLADEVGMGKTYVALGVVAMMRYFNPMLRVLYICPSRNIQEKWEREYKGFIRNNIRVCQGRIRTRDGMPAAPYQSCRTVVDLIHTSASGHYADYFIGKDSFSMGMIDDVSVWERRREELIKLLPAHQWKGVIKSKQNVKEQYARALNYILPTFDLVIIDEAHNFKHDFDSSDRNKVLSRVLGFRKGEGYVPRAKHALLLSATPYDRDINQLRNQLNLVGRPFLLPDEEQNEDTDQLKTHLQRFMVRRLNTLSVNKEELTRNMYRREWRKGERAEILLESDEQKLVAALVQKKVGEMLNQHHESAAYQSGLLASFESFAQTTKSEPVRFDGAVQEKQQTDAKDRHVIGQLVDSYIKKGLGRTLPHPKMDTVVNRLSDAMFSQGKKQIVFVRRVRSVDEIKDKLDDAYNEWLYSYVTSALASDNKQRIILERIYTTYLASSQIRDSNLLGGELEIDEDQLDQLPPKNDTFFAWFFRGEPVKEVIPLLKQDQETYPTPDATRIGLVAKNQVTVNLLEPNWAWYLCLQEGRDLNRILISYAKQIAELTSKYVAGKIDNDYQEIYRACQIAFLEWYIEKYRADYLVPLFDHQAASLASKGMHNISANRLIENLTTSTLYTELEVAGFSEAIIPFQEQVYTALKSNDGFEYTIRLFEIHKALLSFLLRTGHGIIDIYLARIKQGTGNLTREKRTTWMRDFVGLLVTQKQNPYFSTWQELLSTAAHLELIIKNNIPDIIDLQIEEYRTFLSRTLNPVSPVIGATGETSGRSAQARKFRMPGYPLALISTDVFQEGEDLHTFCDSVVHYGISGSPVSIEQKTGRVDRVSSLAQRRLQALERQAEEEEYIQVTFPFVRESIETLQIRKLCQNINMFIHSLHDVSGRNIQYDDTVSIDELKDKIDIPEQIMDKLHSPFDPEVVETNEYSAVDDIENNEQHHADDIVYVMSLIEKTINQVRKRGQSVKFTDHRIMELSPDGITAWLTSARASGELLLSLTQRHRNESIEIRNKNQLLELMNTLSWRTFHRTYVVKDTDKRNAYNFYFNAEMLIGGEGVTQQSEIDRMFERMEVSHDPDTYQTDLPDVVMENINSIHKNTPIFIDRSGQSRIQVEVEDGVTILNFEFGATQANRTHRVYLYESHGRCVFLSHATRAGFSKRASQNDLIKYTWLRNRYIDLVEFVIDPNGAIVGRVVHPHDDMQWDEFIYCAYTLAVEADNLEYVLSSIDSH